MAVRDEPLSQAFQLDPRVGAGLAALAAIALLIGGAFAGMIGEAARDWSGAASAFDGYMVRVARFTLWQAALSTLLSVVPALFVARALARHPRFFGRAAILRLFGVPLALLGYFAVFGLFPAPSVGYSVLVGVLAWGAAGFLFWSTALWLAWCGGRRPRFTTRSLFVAVTLASIYFGLVAIAMTGDPR